MLIDKKGVVDIANECFFNNDCSITCLGKIAIGKGCLFGENVKIYDHNHRFNNFAISLKKQKFSIGEVVIGNQCWIGSNSVILKGAVIGNNCVIGAGCVISGHIPSGSIVRNNGNYFCEKITNKS